MWSTLLGRRGLVVLPNSRPVDAIEVWNRGRPVVPVVLVIAEVVDFIGASIVRVRRSLTNADLVDGGGRRGFFPRALLDAHPIQVIKVAERGRFHERVVVVVAEVVDPGLCRLAYSLGFGVHAMDEVLHRAEPRLKRVRVTRVESQVDWVRCVAGRIDRKAEGSPARLEILGLRRVQEVGATPDLDLAPFTRAVLLGIPGQRRRS
mmetsp:Transcript_96727/g.273261  ORF Transcript_96727/g.273261 Transcript_96727/m.273261 type:complete len:205 (-) Transcript_96727:189-803(-)